MWAGACHAAPPSQTSRLHSPYERERESRVVIWEHNNPSMSCQEKIVSVLVVKVFHKEDVYT